MTVTDDSGVPATAQTGVAVGNVAPTATLTNNGPADEGASATVAFVGTLDPSAADTAAGLTYSFDFDNDGVFDVTGPSPTADVPAGLLVDGPRTLTVRGRVADKDGGFTDAATALTVRNVDPVVVNLATDAVSYREGDTVRLTGTIADPGTADSQTVVIDWADGTPADSFRLAPGATTFAAAHPYAQQPDQPEPGQPVPDPGDGDGQGRRHNAATRPVLVANAPPTAVIRGLPPANPNQIALTSAGTDPGAVDNAGLNFVWVVTRVVNGELEQQTFTTRDLVFDRQPNTTYDIELVVTDPDGATATDQALVVAGTAAADAIVVTAGADPAKVEVVTNGTTLGEFNPGNRVIVFGGAGSDTVTVDPAVAVPTELDGEAGDDRLTGGGGPNVLVGGAGSDTVVAGPAGDLLMGDAAGGYGTSLADATDDHAPTAWPAGRGTTPSTAGWATTRCAPGAGTISSSRCPAAPTC